MLKLLIRAVFAAIRQLPLSIVGAGATFASALLARAPSREGRLMAVNVERVYGLSPTSTFGRLFAGQVWASQCRVAVETLRAVLGGRPKITWEGREELRTELRRLEADGRGQVLVTAHLGSWELVGQSGAQLCEQPFYALAKPTRHPVLQQALARFRELLGVRIIWANSKGVLRDMMRALEGGAWLGFVMDQKPVGRIGPRVPFFGVDTSFVSGPAQMAVRGARPVIAVYAVRLGPMHYRLMYRTLLEAGHEERNVSRVTAMLAEELERAIRLYPEQWTWNYKRWSDDELAAHYNEGSAMGAL